MKSKRGNNTAAPPPTSIWMDPKLLSWMKRRKRNPRLPRPPPMPRKTVRGTTIWRGQRTDIRGRRPSPRRRRTDPIRTKTLRRRRFLRYPRLISIDVSIDHRQRHRRRWSPRSSSSSSSIEVDVDLLRLRTAIIRLDTAVEVEMARTEETGLPRWIEATKADRNRTARILILAPPAVVARALLGLPHLATPERRIRPCPIPAFITIIITIISKDAAAQAIADLLLNHRWREEAIIAAMKANRVAARCPTLLRRRRPP